MKLFTIFSILIVSIHAWANSECTGRASDGSYVTVHIETSGAVGAPDTGEVTIESGGNKYGYRFTKAEMPQYFEFDDVSDGSAIVGIAAYVENEYPVSVKYVGTNFVDMELKVVADDPAVKGEGNFLRVWKGPRHAATDQYQITKIACSVWSNL